MNIRTLREKTEMTFVIDIARDIAEDIHENNEKRLREDIAIMRKQLDEIEAKIK